MRCDEAQEALLGQRYGGATPTDVAAHVSTCPLCATAAQRATALDAILALDPDEPPRPGFDTAFFAHLDAVKQSTASRKVGWRGAWAAWALAGACAVLLGLLALRHPWSNHWGPLDIELALNLDLLQEDLGFMRKLDDVEAYEVLSKLGPEDTSLAPEGKVP